MLIVAYFLQMRLKLESISFLPCSQDADSEKVAITSSEKVGLGLCSSLLLDVVI